MKSSGIHFLFVIAIGAVGAFSGAVAAPATNPLPEIIVKNSPINRTLKAPISFAAVAKQVAPAVVNIYSTTVIKERQTQNPFLNDPFFRRFFGDNAPSARPRERKAEGLGSGVIVSKNGYILTANHVVAGAQSVKVSLAANDKEYDAKVVGTDPPTDIAVLKIEADRELPTLVVGDSDQLEVGDMVLALGNPFGVGQTVTLGIVSGLGRGGFGLSGYEDFIQTDAAINPGNSGGAMVDVEGRLVGINTAILSRSGGFQGVGLAVPVNMARYVMDRLITTGKVTRGFLGISIQALTPELAKEFGLSDESSGVLVGGVTPGGAAATGGLRAGDVILAFNGKPVTDPRSLQVLVARSAPKAKATLKILRTEAGQKPKEQTLQVTLGELPASAFAQNESPPGPGNQPAMGDTLDGVEVADLDAGARQQFKVPKGVQGAVVVSVDPTSNAAEAGLRPGDVILEIDRRPVRDAQEAVTLSEKAKGKRVLLRVWSNGAGGGGTRWIVVEDGRQK